MGVYMRCLKNTGINIGSRIGRFRLSWQDPKTEDRTGRVGRAEGDHQETDVVCPKPSCTVSGFTQTNFSLHPSVAEETERHLVIPSTTLSVVDIFSKPIFPEMTQSRTK